MRTYSFALSILGAASIAATSAVAQTPAPSTPSLQVQIADGALQGKSQDTKGGPTRAFLGIPYATPPVGPLRWKPPVPEMKWTGTKDATNFGPRCMQAHLYDDMVFRDSGPSEDCLTLNVWTPAAAQPSSKLPVMFWIYGGGFTGGTTSEPRQDGAHLSTKGVIVVTFNYRLGVFGFFTHPELVSESPQHAAGNYGLLDAVAALQWVQKNIATFGGDPNNVTIFGESAGSFAVSSLMASPLAHGLFHHAIGESGGAFGGPTLRYQPLETRATADADYARTQMHAETLAQLRALPADQLLAATTPGPGVEHHNFGPDVDGYFLPQSPSAIFAAGKQNDVPMIAGWNHDEGGSGKSAMIITPTGGSNAVAPTTQPSDLDRLKDTAQKDFPAHVQEFLAAYPAKDDAEALTRLQQYATNRFIAFGTWAWLEAQTDTGKAPAYRYRFDLIPPADPARPNRYGVFHSDDIEYVFGNLDFRQGYTFRPVDYAMSEQMMTYWSNFAKFGDPNGAPGSKPSATLPKWPMYAPASGSKVMYLNQPSHADKDDLRDQFLFLQSAWTKQ